MKDIVTWRGQRLEDMTKKELIEAVIELGKSEARWRCGFYDQSRRLFDRPPSFGAMK